MHRKARALSATIAVVLSICHSTSQAQGLFDPESLEFERVLKEEPPKKSKKTGKNKAGKIEVEALVMIDVQQLDGIHVEEDSLLQALIRRARFDVSRDLNDRLKANVSFDIDDGDEQIGVREASLKYEHEAGGSLELGLFKPAFGMEQSASSRELRTFERSMATSAFSPDAGVGLAWSRSHSRFNVSIGAFLDRDQEEAHDVTVRIGLVPLKAGSKNNPSLIHLGINAAWHSEEDEEYRIRQSAGVDAAEDFLRSAEYPVSGTRTLGGEMALVWRALTVQGEWFQQSLALSDEGEGDDPKLEGGYLQIAWLFGGARRKYSNGVFDRVRPGEGVPLELVASYSEIDARFDGQGGEARLWSLGLNYRMNRNTRFMAHYLEALSLEGERADEDGRAVLFRMQLEF